MKIDWTARGIHVPENLKDRVDRHLDKLERYLRGHTEASVIASQEGDSGGNGRRGLEVVLRNRLGTFTAREESHDLTESANAALARLESQVRRAHDKLLAGRRRSTTPAAEEPWSEDPAVE